MDFGVNRFQNDNSLNQEDEGLTLIDLDHQTAHHLELETKESEVCAILRNCCGFQVLIPM